MNISLPTYVCREARGELFELSEVRANVDVAVFRISILVQEHAQQCLGSTSILDCLCCKPHVLLTLSFYSSKVELAILRLVFLRLLASGIFE
jgi:hypothetical protein